MHQAVQFTPSLNVTTYYLCKDVVNYNLVDTKLCIYIFTHINEMTL